MYSRRQLSLPEPPTIPPPTENEDGQLSGGEEEQQPEEQVPVDETGKKIKTIFQER